MLVTVKEMTLLPSPEQSMLVIKLLLQSVFSDHNQLLLKLEVLTLKVALVQ